VRNGDEQIDLSQRSPALVLVLKMIPADVMRDCREKARTVMAEGKTDKLGCCGCDHRHLAATSDAFGCSRYSNPKDLNYHVFRILGLSM